MTQPEMPSLGTARAAASRQSDLFGVAVDHAGDGRALIDQLIADTKLYNSRESVKELLDFTVKLPNIAPFNAMLIHIQKPGATYVMRPKEWIFGFHRRIKPHARPLLILRNFGPVEFVYDINDTEGPPLPENMYAFPTTGRVEPGRLRAMETTLRRENIDIVHTDTGDALGGYARRLGPHGDDKRLEKFEIGLNKNHSEVVRFGSLIHEVAHVYLGHCGADPKRKIAARDHSTAFAEIEAETVAYVVAKRSGVSPRSDKYLSRYQDHLSSLIFIAP
jgi:hypothetical protein